MRDTYLTAFQVVRTRTFPIAERHALSPGEANIWMRRLWRSPWLARRWPSRAPTAPVVHYAKRSYFPTTASGVPRPEIHLGPSEHNKEGVLHGLAHTLARETLHDRVLCRTYLDLVQHFLGTAAATRLKAAYAAEKIPWRAKRQISEETRQRLRVQAAQMRSQNPRLVVRRRIRLPEDE